MADETPVTPAAAPPSDSIPITDPTASQSIPIDLNPEYDPAKDTRAPFLKVNPNPTGPTVEAAPKPSVLERAKKVVTEGIPRYSTRTTSNPKYGQEQFLTPEEAMTPEEQRQAPVAAGALEAAGGLTSPATISTVAATAGLGGAGVIPKVLSALFAGQIAKSVYDQYPALQAATDKAMHAKTKAEHDDAFAEAQQLLTHMGADTVMGLLAAKHGAEGAKSILDATTGSGVPDQASTFKSPGKAPAAIEPEETHPEMNRQTVKDLQGLGYSNQHITNFNIGEIRDILKNQTPAGEHPVSKPAAAPEPDKFAAEGGKLVSQPAPVSTSAETPAVVEKPVAGVEKTAETTDPVESLIMSDKIQGKKVRGAPPKPAEGAITVPKKNQGSDSKALRNGGWFLPDGQTYVHTGLGETHGFSALAMGFPGEAPYTNGGDAGSARMEALKSGAIRSTLDAKEGATTLELGNITDKNRSRLLDVLAAAPANKPVHIMSGPLKLTQNEPKEFANPEEAIDWVDRQTTQSGPDPEALAEHGGKFVGKAPEPAPTLGDHQPLSKALVEKHGTTADPLATGFILSDGRRVPLNVDHAQAVAGVSKNPALRNPGAASDAMRNFLSDEQAVRARTRQGKGGDELVFTVSPNGVTPEQIQAMREAVGKQGRNGNLVIERSDVRWENMDDTVRTKEFAKPSHVDGMLREIGAHPDQKDIVQSDKQGPYKEKYGMEVTDPDGTTHVEKVAAYSNNEAMKAARKKFPDAGIMRLPEHDESHTPSTAYEVPTKKSIKMPASYGRSEADTDSHEVAHALVALDEGLGTGGIISQHHPTMPKDARAAHLLVAGGLRGPDGKILPDKRRAVLKSGLAGIASDEIRGLHRSANPNFAIAEAGDGGDAYDILKEAGFTHDAALTEMHKLIDENIEYLKHPAVSSVVNENIGVRENDLSKQYHHSAQQLRNMYAETERRKANGEGTGTDNAPSDAAIASGSQADVAEGEGGISKTDTGEAEGKDDGIVSKENIQKPEEPKVEDIVKETQKAADVPAAKLLAPTAQRASGFVPLQDLTSGKSLRPTAPKETAIQNNAAAAPLPKLDATKIAGGSISKPFSTYHEASQGETNPWIRRSADPAQGSATSNEKRTLLLQFSSNLISDGVFEDEASDYYDKIYSGARAGYNRLQDFWEVPQWIARISHFAPDADVYVVRDQAEAAKFLNEAKYGHVMTSAMDVNKGLIKDLAGQYSGGQIEAGGYIDPKELADAPNVKWHDSLQDFAKSAKMEYADGVDYRHFQGSDVIPRLTMSDGCSFKCAFCVVPKEVVPASDAMVNQQADAIAKLGSQLVYVSDKTFGQAPNYKSLADLNTRIKTQNPKFKGFVVQTTASQLTRITPEFLKASGIRYVELGIESYNDPILRAMKKPATEAVIDKAVDKLRQNGIALIPNILVGYPGETPETYQHTLDFLQRNKDIISHANIYNLAIYNDTDLGKSITTASPNDFNENVLEKSFHTEPEVHARFAGELYGMAAKQLDKPEEGLFSPSPVVNHIQSGGKFGVLTAENPNNQTLSDDENAKRNEALRQDLVSRGHAPIPMTGHSEEVGSTVEHPYFIQGADAKETAELGRQYGQQSVLTHQGLHDLNQNIVHPRDTTKDIIHGAAAEEQPYFSKHAGHAFSVPIDWNKEETPEGEKPLVQAEKINEEQKHNDAARGGKADRGGNEKVDARGKGEVLGENKQNTPVQTPASDHTVSTRMPTKTVKGETIEDHTDASRLSNMEAAQAAPGYVQKMMNRVNETPGFITPEGTAQEQADAYIRHGADNVKFVHGKTTHEEFARDSQWYPVGAHERGIAVAKQHGFTPHQVYAVTTVESPLTDWDQNTSLAERTTNIWHNQQDTKFTPEMQQAADRISSLPANKNFKGPFKQIAGKTLGELSDTRLQGFWLRLYDDAHNPRSYETWGPDGKSHGLAKNQDGSLKNVGWSFQSHINKAIEILKDGSDENISKQIGYGHKTRNFYNNQLSPNDPRFLTMDTHAVGVAQMRAVSGHTKEVSLNFGGISNGPAGLHGTYPLHDAAYRLAAKELNIPIPSRLQSSTWVKFRTVFNDAFKTATNMTAVDAIWKEHEDGKITADQARNKVWDYAVEWNREHDAGNGPASDQGQLFEGGIHGEPATRAPGRGTGSGATREVPAPAVEDDPSFDFGANAPAPPTAPSRISKATPKQQAKNNANVAGLVEALRGLKSPGSGKK